MNFDALIASDLVRARETAAAIAAARPLTVELDPRLRETDFGAWEGLTWAQIVQADPALETTVWHDPRGRLPHGGESFAQVQSRAAAFLESVRARPQASVCAVSHAGFIHAALAVLFGDRSPAAGVRLQPACVNHLRFKNGEASVVTLNDVSHLAALRD